ncbi:hypothetical protein TorRG33x02_250750 [Trema orientale]|uniref:Uncharacterized protein n=1 Tax=Trema orientale TaxID=63057 RepID=A0A2P5DI06_TREOI|nr:hypothetical protein TorRG33x02_250750 [Trema orientale]
MCVIGLLVFKLTYKCKVAVSSHLYHLAILGTSTIQRLTYRFQNFQPKREKNIAELLVQSGKLDTLIKVRLRKFQIL